ncbi:MAG TPA: 2Fe-2S iron-sulfur cluster-binding protein, partial [Phycisphaerae bacterium]|nr:2Fe-2S iron-sulfur cluster-binding protein [Phycisphaerae bacterium]
MITLTINGLDVSVEEGTTLLEAARFLGFPIPTLCHMDGLSPYGACRLCVVEIGEGPRAALASSCTYPAEEGLKVRTASSRVRRARLMVLELLLASCPQSKTIQDLASAHGVRQQRFRQEHEDCILCGLCVRMCEEQMMAKAIGFRGRGQTRSIGTPFDIKSDVCRQCGGC